MHPIPTPKIKRALRRTEAAWGWARQAFAGLLGAYGV